MIRVVGMARACSSGFCLRVLTILLCAGASISNLWSLATQWLICLSLATLWSLCSILSLCLCIQSPFFVEGQPRVWELVKTTDTIESSSQPRLLNSLLPNYAECRTEDRSGDLLVQMAAQANALMNVEAVTQVDESAVEVNEARRAHDVSTSHIWKENCH